MFLLFPPPLFTGEWICGAGTQAAGFRHMEINFRAENEIEFVCEYNYINFRFRSVIILEHECVCVCVCVSASLYWNRIILFDFLHKPKRCGIWQQKRGSDTHTTPLPCEFLAGGLGFRVLVFVFTADCSFPAVEAKSKCLKQSGIEDDLHMPLAAMRVRLVFGFSADLSPPTKSSN